MSPRSAAPTVLAAVLYILALPRPSCAVEQVLTLDPVDTEVTFLLEATGHDVEGSLYLQAGEIRFDTATGTAAGEIAIDARRAVTGSTRRDRAMHRKVLESEHHPLIVFRAERLEGTLAPRGTSELTLHGTVTLLGAEHPLAMPTVAEVDGDRVVARAAFAVPYVAWGLHDPSIVFLRVAKEVAVSISARGVLAAGSVAARDGD